MRTISGRTDEVVVVGAGLAGLAAALHLAGRGRSVTVVERDSVAGGRAGRRDVDGFLLDTGPSVLTMPDIVADTFAAVGESLDSRLDLLPVIPAYRAHFADGSGLDIHSDAMAMEESVSAFAGPKEVEGYRRLRAWLSELYRVEFDRFIAANADSPLSLLTPALARLIALGGFRRLDRAVGSFLNDERLRRVFTFQSLYAGVSPQRALALYAVISYMDIVGGIYFPRGGMRALPDALAAAAVDAGVSFCYGETVHDLERSGSRITAVLTEHGRRIPCDAVVLATELPTAYELLERFPRRPISWRPAPSAVVMHVRLARCGADRTSQPCLRRRMETNLRRTDRYGRVDDRPVATGDSPHRDRPRPRPARARSVHCSRSGTQPLPQQGSGLGSSRHRLQRGARGDRRGPVGPGLRPGLHDRACGHPRRLGTAGHARWYSISLAHTFAQTGPFRPANMPRGATNAVLAGCGTVPGVGVPTALLSGRLAADRVTGPVSRSWSSTSTVTRSDRR
ncbi:phytoene desaturase family protein [Nocardia fluminea]|uniref:phytoene desaturase family protein n=1 Tax=Nocardia fluminea TaxID=134984 RepID=UPI003D0EE181